MPTETDIGPRRLIDNSWTQASTRRPRDNQFADRVAVLSLAGWTATKIRRIVVWDKMEHRR